LTFLDHTSQFSAIIAKNQMIWNFGNDCAQLCVAVAEHDTQAIPFSRRQCNDFTTIALPSPEKYCPCIRSLVLQCFLYAHAFKMASCVTPLLLYYKAVFLDFCSEYKHNNGITFSPDLELKTSFCLYSINLFRKWLRKLVKWNVKLLLECLEIKF
jgi:hypothetical protein